MTRTLSSVRARIAATVLIVGAGGACIGAALQPTGGGATQSQPSGNSDAERLRLSREFMERTAPPIGAVIAFWGSRKDVDTLEFYSLCDGEVIEDRDSPLFNLLKPDLRNRFVMGYDGDLDLAQPPVVGGENTTPAQPPGLTGAHVLTLAEIPSHSHPHGHLIAVVGDHCNQKLQENRRQSMITTGKCGIDSEYDLASTEATPNAGETSNDATPAGGGRGHTHTLPAVPAQDNRPAFVGMHYIIRIK